jgi:hypothetical protein
MFSTKQSDIFYNDETKEMFVCTVSSVTADKCDGTSDVVYGAVPLIYKITKDTNYKKRVYPKNIDTFTTDSNSDLFALTPTCPEQTNFDSITKPLINYNKTTSRYSVTFLGRYTTDAEGLSLNNYIFEDINSDFYLLDANVYIPNDKFTDDQYTFESGHLHSNLYIAGNTVRNSKPSWFNPAGLEIERSTDYQIAPMHVQATSSLGFNLILNQTNTGTDALTGDKAFPFMYSGGFITYNPKYVAYNPEYTIRVDFTARSFNVPSPTAYSSTQSVGASATRWSQQYNPAGSGEGFCVSFFKNPPENSYIIPNGIGSTLGYATADFSINEVAGTAQATDGLYMHNNWNPNTGISAVRGCVGDGRYGPADSFLGVGFDIGGDFATTAEEKSEWYNKYNSWTATPCSIGIRGNSKSNTKVLTAFAMNTVAASSVPMHTSAADAQFVDYRIDLSNKGTKVTLYNKLTSATDYNTIAEFRLNKFGNGSVGSGSVGSVGSGTYEPWDGLRTATQIEDEEWPLLNIGLSFTTSTKVSQFELKKFEVTGVAVNNPWKKKEDKKISSKIDYLQESSKNLRKNSVNVESDGPVNIEMVVPAKNIIANSINEELNNPRITLCDGSEPQIIEEEVDVKITGIDPDRVDKAIETVQLGDVDKWDGDVTVIKHVSNADFAGSIIAAADYGQGEVFDPQFVPGAYNRDRLFVEEGIIFEIKSFDHICRTNWDTSQGPNGFPQYWLYKSNDITYTTPQLKDKIYNIYINGTETAQRGNLSTITTLLQNPKNIEDKFTQAIIDSPDIRYWELKLFSDDQSLIGFKERYQTMVDDWFFQPLDSINSAGDTISQEKLHDILSTTGGERQYFYDIGVCKVNPMGSVPAKHLDQTGDPYFAATTGYQSGAECINIQFDELQMYLDDVATADGIHNIPITTIFSSITKTNIDELNVKDKDKKGVTGLAIKLIDSRTGKCYWITGKTHKQIENMTGKRS